MYTHFLNNLTLANFTVKIPQPIAELPAKISAVLENTNIDLERVYDLLRYDAQQPLLFNTGLFLILFSVFMLAYRLMRRVPTARMIFVVLFSLYFYYKSSGMYCLILLGVALSDFVLGLAMGKALTLKRARGFVTRTIILVNVVANLGMLAYFKYFNLILDTFNQLANRHVDLLQILLPAGISFFTFRSISYLVDIYRGDIKPCRNLLHYVFYLTFFPPLLAGPVVRAKDMLPQIRKNQDPTREMTSDGVFLIITGLIKKMVIADFISGNFVDRVFDNPALYSGFENLMATFGFLIQLYCDFSGYSDMAIGIALLLGFRFKDNFNAPFKAQSPTEFWHRWHISLSTWLRDYLYFPLGGSRCSKARGYFNQFATMAIGGLWHGASWMYVIWGCVQGGLLVGHKMIRSLIPATVSRTEVDEQGQVTVVTVARRTPVFLQAVNMFVTFVVMALSFMFFRARSLEDVGMMWHQIIYDFHLSVAPQFVAGYMTIVIAMAAGYLLHMAPSRLGNLAKRGFRATPAVVQAIVLALVLLLVVQVRSSDIVPFIYLQY